MKKRNSRTGVARSISEALGLPRTAERIISSLDKAGRYLSVREIVTRVKMSERSVRKYVTVLARRGLLRRRMTPRGRRVAYQYALRSTRDLLKATRQEFASTLRRLEEAVGRLGGQRRSKSSSRSVLSSRN